MTDLFSVPLLSLYKAFLAMHQMWQHISADCAFSDCDHWKLVQFPSKLSIVPYYLSWQKKKYSSIHFFFLEQPSLIHDFSFSGFCFFPRCHEAGWNISIGCCYIFLSKQLKRVPHIVHTIPMPWFQPRQCWSHSNDLIVAERWECTQGRATTMMAQGRGWAALQAVLGHMWPMGHRLDMPGVTESIAKPRPASSKFQLSAEDKEIASCCRPHLRAGQAFCLSLLPSSFPPAWAFSSPKTF